MSPGRTEDALNIIQQENNGFGPLIKHRGSTAANFFKIVSVLVVFILFALSFTHKIEGYLENLKCIASISFVGFCAGEIFKRFCLFTEEVRHRNSRYNGDWMKAFKVTFTFANGPGLFFVFVIAALTIWYTDTEITKNRWIWLNLIVINAILLPSFSYLCGLNTPSVVEQSILNETENMNVADGLAWGYYFGYLKLVLPHVSNQISRSEDFRDKIDVYKLFILVPKNCFSYPKLQEADSSISVVGCTPDLRIDRGGIQGRVYKHSVHKIEFQDETYHCLVEYATPLMNLWDMSRNSEAGLSERDRDEQVKIFLAKLKDILDNCPSTKNKYCLIPFSGEESNVGEIIVRAIKNELNSMSDL